MWKEGRRPDSNSPLPENSNVLQPAGRLFSLFYPLDGYPITPGLLEDAEKETRLHAQLVVFFLQWPSSPQAGRFPGESLNAIWNHGAIPCITWEPMCYEDGKERMITHQQILNGEYDAYIKGFAEAAKGWERPFIIRFAHEMNLARYHWGSDESGYGPKSPEMYQRMFRHVVSLFREAGAQNVLWAFCPNAESVPNTSFDPTASWNRAGNYYPGNGYVDILGMDGYNWGTTRTQEKHGWTSRWRSWQEIFSPLYDELKSISSRRRYSKQAWSLSLEPRKGRLMESMLIRLSALLFRKEFSVISVNSCNNLL